MNTAHAFQGERRNVAILATSQALFLITAITVMTLSGLVGQQLTPDPALATLPVAMMSLGSLVGTLPASLFMKRFGRRTGFLTGAGFGTAGGALSVLAIGTASFWLFCTASLLLGLYQSFAMYYRFAAADVASPHWRSRAISLVLAGGVVAAFLGPWNARHALDLLPAIPDAGPYAVLTGLALLAGLLLVLLRVPAIREPGGHAPERPLRVIATQPAFGVALLSAAVGYTIMILLMTATPLAMRQAGHGMAEIAFIMQWHVLGMFAPSFVTGQLIARFGVHNILLTGTAFLLLSALTAASGTSLPHFWLALVPLGIGWNFLFVGGSHLLTQLHTPSERGLVQGVNDLAIFSLVTLGAFLAGTLLHQLGWALLNLGVLPFVLLTAWVVYRLRPPNTRFTPEGETQS